MSATAMRVRRPLALPALLLLCAVCGCRSAPSAIADAGGIDVHILALNDFHGNLQPPASLREATAEQPPRAVGGVDALAGYVSAFRALHANTLVVSAGDLFGASPLISALFHDEPTIEAMNQLGLDANAVGNHEFDDGKAELLRLAGGGCHPSGVNTCMGLPSTARAASGASVGVRFDGARFPFLAANVRDNETQSTLFAPYLVRAFDGRKLALIGLTLAGTPAIVDRAGIATLAFAPEAATINALVPELRRQGVRAIVVLIHEGGELTGPRNIETLNGCAGELAGSPLRAIVAQLDDAVDLVISGHTHQAYICQLPNSIGRRISVSSAQDYGRVVTSIDLMLDARGAVTAVRARNEAVLRGPADTLLVPAVAALVSHYAELARPRANRVIGRIAAALPSEPSPNGESPLGRLVADAQLQATRSAGAQIAFMNPGGVRAALDYTSSSVGEGDGAVTFGEAFTVQPFANALVTMSLSGDELHRLLEQQFAGCNLGYPPGRSQSSTRVLQVSAGFSYAFSVSAGRCMHVPFASLRLDAVAIQRDATYRVTVNSFLAAGGDDFLVLRDGRDRVTGMLDLTALERYLAAPIAQDVAPRIERMP